MRHVTFAFDLDGTLVDTAPDLVAATNHVLAAHDLPPCNAEHLTPFVSYGAARMLAEGFAAADRPFTIDSPEANSALELFLTYYSDNIAVHSRPFPGVQVVLEGLSASGARLAVCTNKRAGLSRKLLGELGLLRLFHSVAGRDTLPVHKPDPGHLIGAIILADGNPNKAVMVGDSEVDVMTGKRAGIPVIGVTFGYTPQPIATFEPDAVIENYGEFEAAATRLASSL